MNNQTINLGYKEAKCITKKFAKNFYFALKFLTKEKRLASYSIYAITHFAQNSINGQDLPERRRQKLSEIKDKIDIAYRFDLPVDNFLTALRETITKYSIPKQYFDELISGLEIDIVKYRYESFEELYTYCYKTSGIIGLIMLKIFGYKTIEAAKYAIELGIAVQLTNILKDIRKDYKKGRIYLPLNEMDNFKVAQTQLSCDDLNHNLKGLLKFQIERTRNYYESSSAGLKLITDKKSRLAANIMSRMYAKILDKIERNKPASLNKCDRIKILLKIFLKSTFR